MALAKAASKGPFAQVRGLVADLVHAGVEAASLVDVALGEKSQYLVATPGTALLEHLNNHSSRLAGRVGFIWLEDRAEPQADHTANLDGHPGVVGRADRFVETEPQYAQLARRLLGRVWIVDKLADALRLATSGEGLTFVTLAGELVGADGTLIVGPNHSSTGLISRRSELRALRAQSEQLESRIGETRAGVEGAESQIAQEEDQLGRLAEQHGEAVDALTRHDHKIVAAEERKSQLERQITVLEAELRAASAQHQSAAQSLDEATTRQDKMQSVLVETERGLGELSQAIDRLEADRQAHIRRTTETKVELAKSEERLGNLRTRMHQFEESQQERLRAITDRSQQLNQCTSRAKESRRNILLAESEVAELYLRKEEFAADTVALVNDREMMRRTRSDLGAEVARIRSRIRKLEEKIHAHELAAGEVRHERGSMADRLREDYGIELAELEHEPTDEEQHQRDAVQEEIDDLRRKINNIGNVNLEALEELEQLETRHQHLSEQHKDLAEAKASLEKIIDRINVDSRRLFSETLETVRGHFQTLFRDLFGGGQADIVLEEDADILESGIEIVARPPGKEPRSISLLSGGEKTLTCVALLLAIFRSRPSPFCVLDEVDAALDEANIDRFTTVLEGFLTWTQFIIVTHSKKTMTCANTIYGVTMQESGVSKQVSVRFDDVSDNGEIRISTESSDQPPASLDEDEHQAA
jgi:chromosome segregation protein